MSLKHTAWGAALAVAASLSAPQLHALELNASAGVASAYLFRGVDVAEGNPQVFGDLSVSTDMGLYFGIWGSNAGDAGAEYDLSIGWNFELSEDSHLNIGAVNYVYPGEGAYDDMFAESEAYIGYNNGGFEAFLYKNIASKHDANNQAMYFVTGYSHKSASFNIGYAQNDDIENLGGPGVTGDYDYIHFDFSYAFNDNLSFTFSKMLDRNGSVGSSLSDAELDAGQYFSQLQEDDMLFVMTYSLPLAF